MFINIDENKLQIWSIEPIYQNIHKYAIHKLFFSDNFTNIVFSVLYKIELVIIHLLTKDRTASNGESNWIKWHQIHLW
jgi:hypothetical protein